MSILGSISGGLQSQSLNVSDSVVLEIAGYVVDYYCKKEGIVASLVAVVDVSIEDGPNGKIFSLLLKLKVKINNAYVCKIFKAKVSDVRVGIPPCSIVSFEYVEDVSI